MALTCAVENDENEEVGIPAFPPHSVDTEMAQTDAISSRVRYKPQYLMEKPTPLLSDFLNVVFALLLFEVAIRLEMSNMSLHSLQNVSAKLQLFFKIAAIIVKNNIML